MLEGNELTNVMNFSKIIWRMENKGTFHKDRGVTHQWLHKRKNLKKGEEVSKFSQLFYSDFF